MDYETGAFGDLFERVTIHFSNNQTTPSAPETPITPEPDNPSTPTTPITPVPDQPTTTGFTDVEPGQWYCDGVEYAVEKGMMNGVGDGKFNPDGTTTRAMVVTILYRLAGEPYADSEGIPYETYYGFDDVPFDTWYEMAVKWADAEGIVNGTSETTFSPNATITREQLATLLFRYALSEYSIMQRGASVLYEYSDKTDVSSFAEGAMAWAVYEGIITGTGENSLSPKGTATRAQVATILMRFCESIEQQ